MKTAQIMRDPAFLPLWHRLRGHGHVWHRTSLPSLERILYDGQIVPNHGQFETPFPQSKGSYARHLSAVSLFDFDTADEPYIFEHEWKWGTVLTNRLPAGVIIRIRRKMLDRAKLLLPTEISPGDDRLDALPDDIRRARMVIPAVEALHIGPISSATFGGFILTAFGDLEPYLWHEVPSGADALRVLTEMAARWQTDYDRRTAERHARGEYTLADLVEASLAKRERS